MRLTPECRARRLGVGPTELGLGLVEPAEPEEHQPEVETDARRMGEGTDERASGGSQARPEREQCRSGGLLRRSLHDLGQLRPLEPAESSPELPSQFARPLGLCVWRSPPKAKKLTRRFLWGELPACEFTTRSPRLRVMSLPQTNRTAPFRAAWSGLN